MKRTFKVIGQIGQAVIEQEVESHRFGRYAQMDWAKPVLQMGKDGAIEVRVYHGKKLIYWYNKAVGRLV